MTASPAELREDTAFTHARADAANFPDIKNERLRIAREYERLAEFIDGLPPARTGV